MLCESCTAAGVWVIDAKEYNGRVEQVDVGGWLRSDVRLRVGGRDRGKLAEAVHWQMEQVGRALAMGLGDTRPAVFGALCFVRADWKFFARPFVHDDISVAWPKAVIDLLDRPPSSVTVHDTAATAALLAAAFLPA